ncbi:MAG: glycosyltransferase family 39 protein [Bacteroidetes bacterium]|nr:glycosyltransferase family 39 protein [Bacteroidota bacterium]
MRFSPTNILANLSIILIATFALFYHLGTSPIACWDESRQSINAIEMLEHHNPLITTYEGETDLWNTKPSFLVATQAISFRLLGINEFALRLPSAIAALLLCILIFQFFIAEFKSLDGGFVAVLSLLTTEGFNGYHAARTGDFESFLCLFSTLFIIAFYRYVKSGQNRYLTLFFVGLLFAIFAKGIAGLMFMPAVLIYLISKRKLSSTLQNPAFWILLLITTLIILSYYLYREYQTPGFISTVYDNELWGRFGKVVEGNRGKWYYYLKIFFSQSAAPWSFAISIITLIWIFKFRYSQIYSKPLSFFWLFVIVWVFLISLARTKLAWYIVPTFPLVSIILGILYIGISRHYTSRIFPVKNKQSLKVIFICFLIFTGINLWRISNKPLETCDYCIESNQFGQLVNEGIKEGKNFNGYAWATGFPYYANQLFYVEKLRIEKAQIIKRKYASEWATGDKIFFLQPGLLDSVPNHLKPKIISEKFGILEVEIQANNKEGE